MQFLIHLYFIVYIDSSSLVKGSIYILVLLKLSKLYKVKMLKLLPNIMNQSTTISGNWWVHQSKYTSFISVEWKIRRLKGILSDREN